MQLKDNAIKKFFCLCAVLLIILVAAGRLTSYFRSITETDIAYDSWITTLLVYLGEIITACRTVVSFSAIAFSAYYLQKRKAFVISIVFAMSAAFLDYAARFLIDLMGGAIAGAELFTAIWLLLQIAYEWIFIALAAVIINSMKKRSATAETKRTASKYTVNRASAYSLLLVLASHIVLEGYYLADFLLTYTGITNTEIASIIGSFLKIIVIYGGISLILSEGMLSLYSNTTLKAASENA